MNLQRITIIVLLGLIAGLGVASQAHEFSWPILLASVGAAAAAIVQAMTQAVQIPPASPASKVSTSIKPPPMPVLFMLVAFVVVLAGCDWYHNNKGALTPLEDDACVFGAGDAGMSPVAASGFCKVAVDYVNSLLAKKAEHRARALASIAHDGGAP